MKSLPDNIALAGMIPSPKCRRQCSSYQCRKRYNPTRPPDCKSSNKFPPGTASLSTGSFRPRNSTLDCNLAKAGLRLASTCGKTRT